MAKQYLVFKTRGKKVYYETGDGWSENRGRAVRFSLKKAAETYMNRYVKQTGNAHYGVVDADVNTQVLRTLSEADIKRNPARRKVKKKTVRKKARRKNSARHSSKKSHLWFVFVCYNAKVHYVYITDTIEVRVGITDARSERALFKNKGKAQKVAELMASKWGTRKVGVADDLTTAAQIKKVCSPGKK